MKIYRITIIILLFFFAINIKAQNDFTIKINENEVNNALNAIIAARGLNFGDYTGGFGLADWYANINGASIDILTNNQVKINVTDMAIAADINIAVLSFTSVEHLSGEINGIIKIIGNQTDGYELVIDLTDI